MVNNVQPQEKVTINNLPREILSAIADELPMQSLQMINLVNKELFTISSAPNRNLHILQNRKIIWHNIGILGILKDRASLPDHMLLKNAEKSPDLILDNEGKLQILSMDAKSQKISRWFGNLNGQIDQSVNKVVRETFDKAFILCNLKILTSGANLTLARESCGALKFICESKRLDAFNSKEKGQELLTQFEELHAKIEEDWNVNQEIVPRDFLILSKEV